MSKKAAHLNIGANCLQRLEKSKHKGAFIQDSCSGVALEINVICTMFVMSVISYMNCFAFKSCLKIQ